MSEKYKQEVVTSMAVPTVAPETNISLINSKGIIIKCKVESIRNMGRSTKGVRIMRLKGKESLLLATSVQDDDSAPELDVEKKGIVGEEAVNDDDMDPEDFDDDDDDVDEDVDDSDEEE